MFVNDDLGHPRHIAAQCGRLERRCAHADAVDRRELPLRGLRLRRAAVLQCTVTDGTLMQGQGHHGSFSRADTANFMAAIGPAFRKGFVNRAPVSNADIAPTLARIVGVALPPVGKLRGRVIWEMFRRGVPARYYRRDIVSEPGDGGLRTIVNLQYVGKTPYFDAAGFSGRTVGLLEPKRKP